MVDPASDNGVIWVYDPELDADVHVPVTVGRPRVFALLDEVLAEAGIDDVVVEGLGEPRFVAGPANRCSPIVANVTRAATVGCYRPRGAVERRALVRARRGRGYGRADWLNPLNPPGKDATRCVYAGCTEPRRCRRPTSPRRDGSSDTRRRHLPVVTALALVSVRRRRQLRLDGPGGSDDHHRPFHHGGHDDVDRASRCDLGVGDGGRGTGRR